jgi:hypothetical protein
MPDINDCRQKARKGDYAARHRLAVLEYFGSEPMGIDENPKSALRKLTKLSKEGYPDSSLFCIIGIP